MIAPILKNQPGAAVGMLQAGSGDFNHSQFAGPAVGQEAPQLIGLFIGAIVVSKHRASEQLAQRHPAAKLVSA